MKQLLIGLMLIPLLVLVVSCEDDPDYAADIIGKYIVESITEGGDVYDFTELPLEHAFLVEISRDEIKSYYNDDLCGDSYLSETDFIDDVTETAIVYTDGFESTYSFVDGKLRIDEAGDILILAVYDGALPPAVFSDPSLLENDTYEPNNEMARATPITVGTAGQNHYMAACGDQDFFKFSAIQGVSYKLGTTTPSESSLDMEITLASPFAVELESNDDYDFPNLNPGLDWTCPESGDYFFLLEGLYLEEVGNYFISVVEQQGLPKATGVSAVKEKPEYLKYRFSGNLFN